MRWSAKPVTLPEAQRYLDDASVTDEQVYAADPTDGRQLCCVGGVEGR